MSAHRLYILSIKLDLSNTNIKNKGKVNFMEPYIPKQEVKQ